jgi:formiminotetrahydrofolate cyclodeaminase
MDYRTETIRKYLDDAASSLPAPGGGSVSAVAGALGAAMGCMVCNLTVGKEQFAAVKPQVKEVLSQCDQGRLRLFELMQADVEAYSHVSRAYRMSRQTPEEKEARKAAIQEACKVALNPPLQTLRECLSVLRLMERLVDVGNPNLISDVGVAAILAESALRGAKLNVEINLGAIKDAAFVEGIRKEIETAAQEAARLMGIVCQKVESALKK